MLRSSPRYRLVLAALVAGSCAPDHSAREPDDVYASAFEVLAQLAMPGDQQPLYCLGRVHTMTHLLFITQISDPSPSVIHKIQSRGYSIRAITSCKFPNTLTRGTLQELSSGRNAMIVTFGDTVRATADSIDIGVDYS